MTNVSLSGMFFNTRMYTEDNVERFLVGLGEQNVGETDLAFAPPARASLFRFPKDLLSRNVQRGRDHGLPSYNEFRQLCDMKASCSWANRPSNINKENWKLLSTFYQHPKDIDLYIGGLAEDKFEDGATGKTFNCINSRQFKALKDGDRYWFMILRRISYFIHQKSSQKFENFRHKV